MEDEENSKENLNFWIDYIVMFGISHKVPIYDKMSFIRMHNLDVYSVFFIILLIIIKLILAMFRCCGRVILGKKEVDMKEKKE